MKTARNAATGAALAAALVGGGMYLAMAAPDGAATSTTCLFPSTRVATKPTASPSSC